MKILIIGSTGFIGSNLLHQLRKQNKYEVWGADVATDYEDKQYYKIDDVEIDFSKIFSTHVFDFCINCAGAASVSDSIKNPLRDYRLNTFLVAVLLSAVKDNCPKCKVIQLSSAAVYGNPEVLPIKESAVIKPVSPYGLHKKQSEDICKEYHQYFDISVCIMRTFSAYGNNLKKQLFWDIYQKVKGNNSFEFFGTGEETRDFIHIDDIIQAINLLVKHATFSCEIYNIANGEQISIRKAVKTFLEAMEINKNPVFIGKNRLGDPLNWQADTSALIGFGYKQKISLEEGIRRYVKWLKELK